MEKIEIYEKLDKNLQEFKNLENEISMIELAIYKKSVEELKQSKLKEIAEYFEQQAKLYNQKSKKYQNKIEQNIKEYKVQIEKLISIYDNLYINVFKIMQNAINNQQIAIANIVTLSERMDNNDLDDNEKEKIKSNIIACAQKKLNYAVIIDECRERIKWCIKNIQIDMNSIFINNIYQMELYQENIIVKLRTKIFNIILGKSRYKKAIENYKKVYLKSIKKENNLKILEIASIIKGILKQMDDVMHQISKKYEEMICD